MATNSHPEQESLLVVGYYSGQLEVRDFEEQPTEGWAVPLVERDIHLQNVLTLLGQISLREGFQQAATSGRADLRERYGDRLEETVAGSIAKRGELHKQAKWEFARAFGLQPDSTQTEKTAAKHAFTAFRGKFAHQTNAQRRFNYRKKLEQNVRVLQEQRTAQNRASGARPHKAPRKQADPELPKLGTIDRLQALHEDPRAGFLPATHKEKNQVMAFLDYLDNPAYPLGVNNQFFEIHNHQEREKEKQGGAIPGGARALESIIYEFGDYLTQSTHQLEALRDLELRIGECPNPTVSLAEEIGSEHPGYASLVRYIDLATVRDGGQVPGIKDPLRTKEHRWAAGKEPGKHKTVHDIYTRPDPSETIKDHVAERVQSLTIGQMRQIISEAVTDQELRRSFMAQRLRDALQITYSPAYAPVWVHEAHKILRGLELEEAA